MSEVKIHDPELLAGAVKVALAARRASPSQVQRRVYVGWATACRLITEMQGLGIVGERKPSGHSEVLVTAGEAARIFTAHGIEVPPWLAGAAQPPASGPERAQDGTEAAPAIAETPEPLTDPREPLGRLVRETWVAWALEQPGPKPSWLTGWDDLDEGQREVDMRIGAALAGSPRTLLAAAVSSAVSSERARIMTAATGLAKFRTDPGTQAPEQIVPLAELRHAIEAGQ